MQTRACLIYLCLTSQLSAQEILVRIPPFRQLPPPTTFAGLKDRGGPAPTGTCDFGDVSLSTEALIAITLADSSTIHLPSEWHQVPGSPADVTYHRTRLAGPAASSLQVQVKTNGAFGRSSLANYLGQDYVGSTCEIDRGDTGAIWTLYDLDAETPKEARPYGAFGEVITPTGKWLHLSLWVADKADRPRLASLLTESVLYRPR